MPLEVATSDEVWRGAAHALGGLDILLAAHLGPDSHAAAAVAEALERSRIHAACDECAASPAGLAEFCVEEALSPMLCEVVLEMEDLERAASLMDRLTDLADSHPAVFRVRLARAGLGAPGLLKLHPDAAIEGVLLMVAALMPLEALWLWRLGEDGEPDLAARAGDPPSPEARELGGDLIRNPHGGSGTVEIRPDDLMAIPVKSGSERSAATLVAGGTPAALRWSAPVIRQTAATLGAILERVALLESASARESSLSDACERRLLRLALDVHDGPLQNVAGISGDLKLVRQSLERFAAGIPDGPRLLGSIGDLEARLEAIDTELRDLSQSLGSPAIATRPLAEVLNGEAETFKRRCAIDLDIDLTGELDDLTSSQRIALVRIVQESLSNIREHSRARAVRVSVFGGRHRLEAKVTDDGCGFDVGATILEAGRRGRLGLVGVTERVRLLGGRCEILSRPGGPTTIAVELPRWRPGPGTSAPAEPLARLVAT